MWDDIDGAGVKATSVCTFLEGGWDSGGNS